MAAAALLSIAAAGAEEDDPWAHVERVRASLAAASPLQVDFVQSYTPSGFSVADEESGTLAMRLAGTGGADVECVRWDYEEPFAKGFLLCDRLAWSWNVGEESGRRQLVGEADSFGLDLLRLGVERLRNDYRATVAASAPRRVEVRLVPTGSAAAEIGDATLELDPEAGRLLALGYHDVDGNLTRFELGEARPVPDPGATFTPPVGLDWLEE